MSTGRIRREALVGEAPGRRSRVVLLLLVTLAVVVEVLPVTRGADLSAEELRLHGLLLAALLLFAWYPTFGAALALVAGVAGLDGPYEGLTTAALAVFSGLVAAACPRWMVGFYLGAFGLTLVALHMVDPELWSAATLATEVVIAAVASAVGFVARRARRLSRGLASALRRAEGEAVEARELERVRIADELHDSIVRDLAAIVIQANLLTESPDPALRHAAAAAIRERASGALSDVRGLVLATRDAEVVLSPSLADRIGAIVSDGWSTDRPPGRVILPPAGMPALPAALSAVLCRVLDEALANADRHAPGQPASVRVAAGADDWIELDVRNPCLAGANPGRGADSGGYGIARLREQVTASGGTFAAGHVPETGEWRVVARMPLTRSTSMLHEEARHSFG